MLSGKIVTSFLGLAINALLARLLTPEDLGNYFLAFSIATTAAIFAKLGLHIAVVKLVAENMGLKNYDRVKRVVITVMQIGLLCSITAALLYYTVFGNLISHIVFQSAILASITGLISVWIILETMNSLVVETFRGFHDIRLATLFGGCVRSILLSLCLFILWRIYKEQASLSTIIPFVIGALASSTFFAIYVLRLKLLSLPVKNTEIKNIFGPLFHLSWPLYVVSIFTFALTQADIWIVGAYCSTEDVAVYGAALRLVRMVAIPLMLINFIVPPFIAEMYAQGKKKKLEKVVRSAATLAGIPALIILSCFIAFGDSILDLIYGNFYRTGAVVLVILSCGQLMNVFAGSCGMMLVYSGNQKIMMNITVFCGIISIIASILIVPMYGTIGIAFVFSASLIIQNILMLYYAKIKTGIFTAVTFSLKLRKL